MKARKNGIVKYRDNTRSTKDGRKKVAYLVVEYISESGYEYRRSFEAPPFTGELKMFEDAPEVIEVAE